MRKAEKINPKQSVHHFTIGNMFAHTEEYTAAIHHYKQALELQPEFTEASQRLFAVLCQAKLHHKLEQQHESLKKTLEELRKFKNKQDEYRERVDRLESRIEVSRQCLENNELFRKKYAAKMPKVPIITLGEQLKLETAEEKREGREREKQREITREQAKKESKTPRQKMCWEVDKEGNVNEYEQKSNKETAWVPRWLEKDWPELRLCDQHVKRLPDWKDHPSSYIDPETRGFKVRNLEV